MKTILRYLIAGLLSAAFTSPVLAQSLQLLGSVSSPNDPRGPVDAVVSRGTLYTANFGQSSISVYDMSQPTAPRRISTLASPARPRQVELGGSNRLYVSGFGVGDPLTGMVQAVDVSSATNPREIARITTDGIPLHMAVNGSLVCFITRTKLYVYDANLLLLSNISLAGSQAMCLSDNYLYVQSEIATNTHRLFTYDVSVPAAPVLVSTSILPATSPVTGAMVRYKNALYIGYGGLLFDISNPAAPVQQGSVPFGFSRASGSTAYVGGYGTTPNGASDNVQVYDLRVPFAPYLDASVTPNPRAEIYAATGEGEYVYVVIPNGDVIQVYKYTARPLLATQPAQAQPAPRLYPNPSEGAERVTLTMPAQLAMARMATVYDSYGRLLSQQIVPSGSTQVQLEVTGLAAGLYVVRCGEITQKFTRR